MMTKNSIPCLLLLLLSLRISLFAEKYEPEWDSLLNYEAPEWYEDAKFGFWLHWGVYSVPGYMGDHAAEWYGRWMYSHPYQGDHKIEGGGTNNLATHIHHIQNYGDPTNFGYKNFIPMFKAQKFDADEWAKLGVESGAKFFTMMGVHADNYCLWDSDVTKWNSMDMGPKRDLVGEVAVATRKAGLRFGVSNHHWGYMFFMWNYINGYDALANPDCKALYGDPIISSDLYKSGKPLRWLEGEDRSEWLKRSRWAVKASEYDVELWDRTTNELADKYSPDLYYFDWCMNPAEFKEKRTDFLAHYYNSAIAEGKGSFGAPGVVVNYKGGAYPKGSAVIDHERGRENEIKPMVWQTDDSIYFGNNWSYAEGIKLKPADMLIDELIDVVSKNGILMLSFAPKADGTFPQDQIDLAHRMGDWLNVCGEAIYATRPYVVFGETPEHLEVKHSAEHRMPVSTPEDIRFTRNKANNVLYATFLEWPGKKALIQAFAGVVLTDIKSVRLIGVDKELKWKSTKKGMEVRMPKKPQYGMAYPVRIEFEGEIVAPTIEL